MNCDTVCNRVPALATAALLTWCAPVTAADLKAETIAAWNRYVALAEARIQTQGANRHTGRPSDDQALLLANGIRVVKVTTTDAAGADLDIPSATIHDWRGAVLIPRVTVDDVLEAAKHPVKQEGVLALRVLEQTADSLRLYLKLVRRNIVTVTYNTEHDVRFVRHSPTLASCRSVATRIAELADVGEPNEHEQPVGQDHGFMWRLNAYWRYEQIPEGVVVELESLTLSRSAPLLIGPLVRPIVNRIARESMIQTLDGFRQRFAR